MQETLKPDSNACSPSTCGCRRLLQGKERPSSAKKLLGLAHLCRDFGRPHAAAGLYAVVFVFATPLADDLDMPVNRYKAACAAARSRPKDARGAVGEAERAALRRQALDWLRADLALRGQVAARRQVRGPPAHDLADRHRPRGRTGPGALGEIARHRVRGLWRCLWADVDASLAVRPAGAGPGGPPHAGTGPGPPTATQKAIKGGATDDGHVWFEYAAILLLAGDSPGYKEGAAPPA